MGMFLNDKPVQYTKFIKVPPPKDSSLVELPIDLYSNNYTPNSHQAWIIRNYARKLLYCASIISLYIANLKILIIRRNINSDEIWRRCVLLVLADERTN